MHTTQVNADVRRERTSASGWLPSLEEQLELVQSNMAKVTQATVDQVLAPLGLRCIKFSHFKESGGVINPIFLVSAVRADELSVESVRELVLRVSNPHPYWQRRKTTHEVAVMEFVRKHADPSIIPLANVLAFSADASTSPLGCEYVLMDKVEGEVLEDLWTEELSSDERRSYIDQLVNVVVELRRISVFLPQRGIGGFDSDMRLCELVQDGPPIGPFECFSDYVESHIRWGMEGLELNLSEDLVLLDRLRHLLPQYIDSVLSSYRGSTHALEEEFCICHTDLNLSNVLVDRSKCKIVAILDWEKSQCTIPQFDAYGEMKTADKEYRPIVRTELAKQGLDISSNGFRERMNLYKVEERVRWCNFTCVTWHFPLRAGVNELNEDVAKAYRDHASHLIMLLETQLNSVPTP